MVSNLGKQLAVKIISNSEMEEAPVKWCVVSLSEMIARGKRLEASVFDVDCKHARELIQNCKYTSTTIGGKDGLTTSYTCPRFKRIWVEKSNYPIYQPSSILDIKPTPDGYISQLTPTNIDGLRVRKGQILLTCSGTIGKVSLVSKTLENAIFSHDLLRINCRQQQDIGYIYAYLKSETGNKILLTNSYGAVVTHIESEHLSEVVIPNPPKKIKEKINSLILRSFELRDKSNELIDKATQLMVVQLKLPPLHDIKVKTLKKDANVEVFSVKLSEMNGRVDASYHVSVVDAIIKHLKENSEKVTTIGDKKISSQVFLPGRFKRNYVTDRYGTKFFGIKQITSLDPMTEKYLSLGRITDKMREELLLKEGMLLISRSGTIGNLCIVPKHWNNWIASEDLIRVRTNDDIGGFVYCFLLSEYGQALIKKYAFGSVQDHIDCEQVSNVPIPLLKNKDIQKQINILVLEANQKRYEAYVLEQDALRIMDEDVIFAK